MAAEYTEVKAAEVIVAVSPPRPDEPPTTQQLQNDSVMLAERRPRWYFRREAQRFCYTCFLVLVSSALGATIFNIAFEMGVRAGIKRCL